MDDSLERTVDILTAQVAVLQIALVRSLGTGERMMLRESCRNHVGAMRDSDVQRERNLALAWEMLGDTLDRFAQTT